MKGCRLLLLAGLMCTGCVHLPTAEPEHKPEAASAVVVPPRPVTADQVTPANAGQVIDVLQQEMDRAGYP